MAEMKPKRAVLNTTISGEVMQNFRDYCNNMNCPMNVVLETFMEQFANGQFSFKLIKEASLDVNEETSLDLNE